MENKKIKVIIVGGVAGGASAATRLRRLNEQAEIILLERGEHVSFANCGLPYYIGGVIKEKDKLLVQTPQKLHDRFNIDVRVFNEALEIDRAAKKLKIKNLRTNEVYEESYDKLILSPGAAPLKPAIPGITAANIFTLRNIPDTFAIKDYVDNHNVRQAVVVGGGFIGMEMAENLAHRGVAVTVVEMAPQIMTNFDGDMAALFHQHLKVKKVALYLNDKVTSFTTGENKLCSSVVLQGGEKIETDLVIFAAGVKPESDLAVNAGLEIGTRGLRVNEKLQTKDPDIFAIGDVIEVKHRLTQKDVYLPLAGPANKQGRIVANIISGIEDSYDGGLGSSVVKIFDLTGASTGLTEKMLQQNNMEYKKVIIEGQSHAGYYPGALPLFLKLLFAPTDGRVLGVQVIGYDGVEKRADTAAVAIYAGLTVFDLTKIDLTYAPPYSSAKDPLNMAGYVAENLIKNKFKAISAEELINKSREDIQLIDVSDDFEYELGTIEGAKNLPLNTLRQNLDQLDKERTVVVFCRVGLRGYLASRILMQHGFNDVYNLNGGYKFYTAVSAEQDNRVVHTIEESEAKNMDINNEDNDILIVDACGLQCPGPIMKTNETLKKMEQNDIVKVKASDPGYYSDIKVWCEKTGHKLLSISQSAGSVEAVIQKGAGLTAQEGRFSSIDGKTMVVFSGDLDKAIAAFIIANGAASMNKKVTMFFTFWGLNILRKPQSVKVKKNIIEKMFALMMPRGSKKLALSQMNMGGLGAKMIRWIMANKNVDSLELLISEAQKQGVRLIACNMSMDIMGIKKEELIDGVEVGGVATFIGSTDEANASLFI